MASRTQLYTLYIFNRDGTCLYIRKFISDSKAVDEKELEIEKKNMFGLLFTLKTFVNQITPRTLKDQEKEPIRYFQTEQYQLHYLETVSGLRFAISTSPDSSLNMQGFLSKIYRLYVDYVIRNPSYNIGTKIDLPGFNKGVDQYVKALAS